MKYIMMVFVSAGLMLSLQNANAQASMEDEQLAEYHELQEYEKHTLEIVDEKDEAVGVKEVEASLQPLNPGFASLSDSEVAPENKSLKTSHGAEELPYSVVSAGDYKAKSGSGFFKALGEAVVGIGVVYGEATCNTY